MPGQAHGPLRQHLPSIMDSTHDHGYTRQSPWKAMDMHPRTWVNMCETCAPNQPADDLIPLSLRRLHARTHHDT